MQNPGFSKECFTESNLDSAQNPADNSSENNKRSLQKSAQKIPILLSIDKAAKISGLGRNNLAYLIKYHKLPVVKLPGYNRIKIHYDDLMNFIENNKCIYSIGGIKHSRKSSSSSRLGIAKTEGKS